MKIPFSHLQLQYDSIKDPMMDSIAKVITEFQFLKGQQVSLFEQEFAKKVSCRNCISTGNGTDALFLACKSLGIKPGDEVITPAFSWISSSEVISLCGAKPVFIDVDTRTYTLDPDLLESKITAKTRAVIVVHLYGQMADMHAIKKICTDHNLSLIEDCAQAHLSRYEGQPAGSLGDVAAFSFYPTKNLGAYGDAGCVVTNDPVRAEFIRRFANHGALQKDDHEIEGINSRMDTLQAAVLLAKLPYLEQWNQKRIANAALYSRLLGNVREVALPFVRPNTTHTFHLYVIRTKRRDALKDFLASHEIQTLVHYPKALPNLPAYKHLGLKPSDFPVSSTLEKEVLSLPVYPELTETQIEYVSCKIREFFGC